ncbi:hypothetical protein ONS95_007441 [Cadophora gregata]|uniref:uncharacterized protein n=1 Tax=Cadophora gregata TaxID=51156 RepID=UPI0026DA8A6C|nr:uncharacterized protein ONS95_007441 [Cadophora gregata]KAK0118554.1 hypothetical protein ONS96_011647 [Cadophora gregata f. sp. sojae]KAK0125809.1 hypothetical protein ONS95_007441 [Cadophora gregata]
MSSSAQQQAPAGSSSTSSSANLSQASVTNTHHAQPAHPFFKSVSNDGLPQGKGSKVQPWKAH